MNLALLTSEEILSTWRAGGAVMLPLAGLAGLIYFSAMEMFFYFRKADFRRVPETEWEGWIGRPEQSRGEIGEIIRYCVDDRPGIPELQRRFAEVRNGHLPRIDRRILFLAVLVSLAPLLGLLGTVTGMLTTFDGLSGATGKIIDTVAAGISEALITTQVGLTVAIPGYILVFLLTRRRQQLAAFLARLETKLVQHASQKPNPTP